LVLFIGCGARRTPDLERVFADMRARDGKRPIIVVPGAIGSEIINSRTGEVVWPKLFRSSDDELDLPVSPDLAANRDSLVAGNIIRDARFLPLLPKVNFFKKLLDVLRKDAGYREGDWYTPAPDGDRDTFYVFPYDWRRDNVETARLFIRRVEELKRKLNRPDLRFNIVTQSMGGLVARYAAMYGDADLPDGDIAPQPTWAGAAHINSIVMFAVPNEGAAEFFAMILDGYSLTDGSRRRVRLLKKLSRHDVLSEPSMFQMIPHPEAARFLDGDLKPLKVDLYDPETWRRYSWSAAFDPTYRRRFAGNNFSANNKSEDAAAIDTATDTNAPGNTDAYLAAVLRRAKRFHEALSAPTEGEAPVKLLAFGSSCVDTLDAPVILRDEKKNRWVTLVRPRELRASNNRRLSRDEVKRAMYAPGDGRMTRRSLLGQSLAGKRSEGTLYDTTLPISYAAFVCETHSGIHSNKIVQDNALTQLVNEAMK
ncbi:MAG TPA: hypothetical protein VM866_07570, partial [Pyrinomonadaceae bacterium]|nr:hypothetical protein [Pyrinomonadaceae bacterium]